MRFKYYLRGAGIGVIAATLILSIAFLFQNHISDEEVIRRAIELGMVMEDGSPGTLADMQQPDTSAVDLEQGADDPGSGNEDGTDHPDGSSDGSDSQGSSDDALNPDQDPSNEQPDHPSGQDPAQKDESEPDTNKDSDADKDKDTEKGKDTEKNDNSGSKPDSSSKEDTDRKDPDKDSESKPSGGSQTSNKAVITIESGDVSRIVSAKVFEAGLVDSADEFNSYLGEHGYANLLQPGTYEITKGATFRQIAVILTTRR